LSVGANETLAGIDLSNVADGAYTGNHEFKRWTNIVTVQVKDHAITSIEATEPMFADKVTDVTEEVFSRVISAQSTLVDTVSGATVTSKAYLKSIEAALK
jgi:uncharacterized protein with FMN-binding domain